MSTAISFPYNQSVIAFTPSAGTYQNVTFVVCCTGTGLGGGQLEPTSSVSSNSAVNYQSPIPFSYDLDSGGGSNTSLCFLLNFQKGWINQSPPYYFVLGTTSQHLWLYSLTPAAAGEDFTSSNITPVNQVDEFDTEVASLFYYPPLNLLFVGGNNGNLYTYSVTWSSSGVPSFTYQGANKNYTSPTGCAVSLTFFYNSTLTPNTPNTNNFNQYVPAGSYQTSSSNISITIKAQCLNQQGQSVASSLTFTTAQAANIGDIANIDGKLTIVSGSGSTTNSINNFGQYVPAGSYQNSSSNISITIQATCSLPGSSTQSSTLTYPAEAAPTIVTIENNNGELILITPVFLLVTGLNQGSQNGTFYFPISLANNGVLPNAAGMLSYTQYSVATVVSSQNQTIYTATQSAIVAHAFNDLQGGTVGANPLWNASNSNELILSMVGVPNPQGYTYQGHFAQGALAIGTVSSSSGATNTTQGNLYALDPTSGYVYTLASASNSSDPLTGSPFSLFADANYHLFVNYGSSGLLLYTLPQSSSSSTTTSGSGTSPDPINLIPNVTESSSHGWWKWVVLGLIVCAVVVVSVATDGVGDAALVEPLSDVGEASDLGDVGDISDAGDTGGYEGDAEGEDGDSEGGESDSSGSDDDNGGTFSDSGSDAGDDSDTDEPQYYIEQNEGGYSVMAPNGVSYPFYLEGEMCFISSDTPAGVVNYLKNLAFVD